MSTPNPQAIATLEYEPLETLLSGIPEGSSLYIERLETGELMISRIANSDNMLKPEKFDYWIVNQHGKYQAAATVIISVHEAAHRAALKQEK